MTFRGLRPEGTPNGGAAILQPWSRLEGALDYVPAEAESVFWGRLPGGVDPPVLTVDSGQAVTIDTLSHEGLLADQGSDPVEFFGRHGVDPSQVLEDARLLVTKRRRAGKTDGPHVVTGPIQVRGARPGDVLRMTLEKATPRVPYGIVSNRHMRGALPGEYPRGQATVSIFADLDPEDPGTARMALRDGGPPAVRFPTAPFLGIMGVATPGDRLHSVPPGAHGGNIDIKLLTEGASVLVPVQVPGAMAYVGDPHFAQGDGEVALTALEASLRVVVRFEIIGPETVAREFGALISPMVETPELLVPTGLDSDLDEAVRKAVRNAISLLVTRFGMSPEHAYAYLSAAADVNISQVVDLVTGAHVRIRKNDFREVAG
ncbi:acetamidase [Kocuria sp. JC486]|uniref:acetamidase/formamidase family protein n=1 Tax=Kocuria sp. JC486 TaxID=1970736 RepID=UPI0014239493|nr:acetamidase/formamidase family protein [Kocuria sp. JC486]NHU86041.1 acetamidase [Kocuria sp. JC486]